eukprot:ANDGO_06205.mRNA.1 hypothetical protein DFA_10003
MENFPVIDLEPFLNGEACPETCAQVAKLLHDTGILILRDPRVSESDNDTFLNLMERYYDQPDEVKLQDVRPHLSYQVGATPEGTEVARNNDDAVAKLGDLQKPHELKKADPKWRFFWRVGERPAASESKYPELNAAPVYPKAFPEWESVMNMWGGKMIAAVRTAVEMLALGFSLPRDTFTSKMVKGPHLLAPTGSNIAKFHDIGAVMAGFHYDLNFLTCHGRSRYPGLYAWLRDGTKVKVRVPSGCLLVQAGKQAEWLTGGYVMAGFHEVVVTEDTLAAWERAKQEGRSEWRVSSTLFSHIASDVTLQPVGPFATEEALAKYPPTDAGKQVADELQAINLSGNKM